MSEQEEKMITLVDADGNETLYEILFTFESEDYGKAYILLIPAGSEPEDQAKDAELYDIESDEEWDMVEGVLDTFLNDENLQ